MILLWTLPFILQGVVIGIDEFYFHIKRGLPRFERIGHPFDTLTLLMSMLFLFLSEPSEASMKIYIALALFSCLAVTKDEFIHAEVCSKLEHFFHALLFLLHPIVLIAAGFLWKEIHLVPLFRVFFGGYIASVLLFFFYQIIFWNFLWERKTR